MRRQILFGSVVAIAMAVGVGAQDTSQASPQSDKSSGKSVTVTGCLQKGDASSTTGTTGTTAGTAAGATSSGDFVLNNVSMGSGSSTTTAGGTTAGTTGSAAASSYASGLKLSAGPSEDLSKYVNHKVEIRGTIDSAMSGSTPSTTADPSASASSSRAKPTLKVSSIKELSDTCSGGGQ